MATWLFFSLVVSLHEIPPEGLMARSQRGQIKRQYKQQIAVRLTSLAWSQVARVVFRSVYIAASGKVLLQLRCQGLQHRLLGYLYSLYLVTMVRRHTGGNGRRGPFQKFAATNYADLCTDDCA